MIEFCKSCKGSLPTGDLTIRQGEKYTSYDYLCPHCGKLANPPAKKPRHADPEPDKDIVISDGESKIE